MRVAVFSVILVGKVIWDIKLCDKRFSRNLLTLGDFACLRRLRLKSPVRMQFLFSCIIILRSSSIYIFIIELKVLCGWVFVDSTQYATLFIGNYDFNEYRFQFFWTAYLKVCSAFI